MTQTDRCIACVLRTKFHRHMETRKKNPQVGKKERKAKRLDLFKKTTNHYYCNREDEC